MHTVLLILTIMIRFERASICAEDTVHHPITIEMKEDATLKDLVQHIMTCKDGDYDAIPTTGMNMWWQLTYDKGTLAYVCDNRRDYSYANVDSSTLLKDIPITVVHAHLAELPTNQPGGVR